MGCLANGYDPVNQFALVSYIPDPLGEFLDILRLRLAPECRPHAHVTVLPPRPLKASVECAEAELRSAIARFHAFDVKLGQVELFEKSDVIYIGVESGQDELREMHELLNRGAVDFEEPFAFHPHITLAQNLPKEQVQETLEHARQFWSEWKDGVWFPVEELSFVQNTAQGVWLDLLHLRLAPAPAGVTR